MMRIPVATYRLQFTPTFGFPEAKDIIAYLATLGISDIYASPIFKARQGSTHGYDVVDPNQLNPELGTAEDFASLISTVQAQDMGWLQDIVLNHMAYDGANQMLRDVLENGECSEYIAFFDIDWQHPYESIRRRVLAPFLGQLYGDALESGEITLQYDQDGFTVNYYALQFPLKMESYHTLLTYRLYTLRRRLTEEHPDYIKLLGILYAVKNLPVSREEIPERASQIRFINRMLWELYSQNPLIKQFIDENLSMFSGEKGNPESINRLDALLAEQYYRLSFWKVATEEINYRRFFNINELISLRMEDKSVFQATHTLIQQLLQAGSYTGLRIDHIDGLYDPAAYLQRLRELAGETYIVVEKILEPHEELPEWPIQGTTGYDFLHHLNMLFCHQQHAKRFDRIYTSFSGLKTPYAELVYEKKKFIIERDMAGDVDNLAHLLKRIPSRDRHASDITLYRLKRAMVEVLAFFPVYCTYVSPEMFRDADRLYIQEAIHKARERNPNLLDVLNFMERFLLLEFGAYLTKEEQQAWVYFVMRFQQLTGPLMAKGFEDTTLYVYNRLLSLNEVGGSPHQFGISIEEWHAFNVKRARCWPHTLNATATHDTKRGEDVRARINVLSEIPTEWEAQLKQWSRINQRRRKRTKDGLPVPGRNMEYFLYQTLIGAFPFAEEEQVSFRERIKNYIIKAVREAKIRTTWIKPDTEYEEGFLAFIDAILHPSPQNRFLQVFLPFQQKVALYGIWNSLAQTLLKITAPGVPDFYQGTEFWDLNLVDPDNRRPVNFVKRKRVLQDMHEKAHIDRPELLDELLTTKEDGRIKLFLIATALQARQVRQDLFTHGEYLPIEVQGKWKDHVVAFARRTENVWAITVVPRLLTELIADTAYPVGMSVWEDTHLVVPTGAPMVWKDVFTTQHLQGTSMLPIGDILRSFPVALLGNEEEP